MININYLLLIIINIMDTIVLDLIHNFSDPTKHYLLFQINLLVINLLIPIYLIMQIGGSRYTCQV